MIAATVAGMRVVGVYVPNGQAVDSDKYRYKLAWFAALRPRCCARELARHPRSRCSATSTSRPRTATCTTRRCGRARCCAREPERAAFRALLGARPRRQLPPVRAAGEDVQLVGLPAARVPEEPRPAHRPHPAVRARSPRAAPRAASTATRARARSRRTTRRCWSSCATRRDPRSARRRLLKPPPWSSRRRSSCSCSCR